MRVSVDKCRDNKTYKGFRFSCCQDLEEVHEIFTLGER